LASEILVIEDEQNVRRLVRIALQREGFSVIEAADGKKGLETFAITEPDLIILDLMLPGVDGWEVCREIRSRSSTPLIMLTARGDEVDRVLGLEMGADDYVVKPFSPRELVARVKAVLRRQGTQDLRDIESIEHPGLMIHPGQRTVLLDGEAVRLTPKEFDLLALLASHPGKAFPRERLLQRIWGHDYWGDERTIDVHVTRLREKLGKNSGARDYISTVWGIGYKFEVAERE